MPTIIYTGDPQKCKQINLIECPVCGASFELTEGAFLYSALLDSDVKVCGKHTELSVDDELRIQEAVQRAIEHPRGRVQQDGVLLKRCKGLEEIDYKPEKG